MSVPIIVTVDSGIGDLVPLFLEQRRADQADLERAIDTGDLKLVRRAAHAIAGASAS